MSLLHTPTAAESRRLIREKSILCVAEALNNLVSIGAVEHRKFWGVDPVQLVDDLNGDLANALALMSANSDLFAAANTSLDILNLPQYAKRAPTEIGHPDITFDGEAFVYTAPPEPEIEAEEQLP